MKRRQLLQAGLVSASSLVAFGSHSWFTRSTAQSANPNRLIVVFLRGAIDGLNVVVPYRETEYYDARPTIALPQPNQNGGVLDLDGQFGLHPALSSILPLWKQGSLAFVHSSGSPDPTRSHFDAQDNMERSAPGVRSTQDGWMNRLLSVLSNQSPIQAINVGNATPRILSGRMSVATLAPGRNAARPLPVDQPRIAAAFDRLYAGNDRESRAYREGQAARKALLSDLNAEQRMANNGAPLPFGFARDAQRLAQIMRKDPRVSLGFMAIGGWDTHVNESAQLARNLEQLGKGLAALQSSLGSIYANTTIVVMSEFGRTVHENGDRGTDHGHGNVMWLMGGGVRGGKVYGDWRGLSNDQLYQERDLAITTDFRDVIATVLERHLQLPDRQLDQILPQYQPMQRNLPLYG